MQKNRSEDLHLFDVPKDARLKQTWEQKRLWLASVKAAIIAWERERGVEDLVQEQTTNLNPTDGVPMRVAQTDANIQCNTVYEGRRPRVRLRT